MVDTILFNICAELEQQDIPTKDQVSLKRGCSFERLPLQSAPLELEYVLQKQIERRAKQIE